MQFEHDGRTCELVCITDVSQNGYGLEMSELGPEGAEALVMTAFRPFGTRRVRVSMHAERLDFEVVKVFLDTAKVNLVDRIEPPDLEEDS
jgi:hypothetical protein